MDDRARLILYERIKNKANTSPKTLEEERKSEAVIKSNTDLGKKGESKTKVESKISLLEDVGRTVPINLKEITAKTYYFELII